MGRVLSRSEVLLWIAAFLVVSTLLAVGRFTSDDADSSLYAGLSARIAEEPVSRWIAPEWWGLWPRLGFTGLYRDHPIGGFILPAIVARLGVPGEQAAYVVGIGAGIAALWLIASMVGRILTREDARAVLILLQIMPVAFVFRIRANQEYAMLVCLLVACLAVDRARRHWSGWIVLAVATSFALMIKGAFVIFTLAGALLWLLLNPTMAGGRRSNAVGAAIFSIGAALLMAAGYDWLYRAVTGESFWLEYWNLQMSHVEVATPLEDALTLARHTGFYLLRLLWHPAPWSAGLLYAAWRVRRTARESWSAIPAGPRRALTFTALYAIVCVLILSPSSRVAERYLFSAIYGIAAAGIIASCQVWPALRRTVRAVDVSVPAAPAMIWLALMLARLGAGHWMPRI